MTKNLSQKILIFCFIIAILVAPFLYTNNNILNEVSAYSSTSGLTQSEKAITVDEIWNGTSFNKQNLQIFTDKIFRSITNLSYLSTTYGVSNYNIKSKNSAKELVVKIGGLDWIVSYISRANVDKDNDGENDIIVSLWLVDSSNVGQSMWQNNWSSTSTSLAYPSNMYGTSYIRAKINGGKYAQPYKNSSYTTLATGLVSSAYFKSYGNLDTISTSNMFSSLKKYALSKSNGGSDLYNYIVEPRYVDWQMQENTKTAGLSFNTNCPNDGSSQTKSSDSNKDFATGFNYISKTGYEAWITDKLWLPSVTETGYRDYSYDGLWELSVAQRANSSKTWLRSGDNEKANLAGSLFVAGNSSEASSTSNSYSVRPAFHFNLSHALKSQNATFEPIREDVEKPVVQTSVYNYDGGSHKIIFQDYDTTKITISGNTTRTSAGSYIVTISLKNTTYYQWTDKTTDSYTETLVINKRQIEKPSLKSTNFSYTGNNIYAGSGTNSNTTINYNNYSSDYINITGTTYAKNVGSYTLTITLKNNTNYEWSDGTISSFDINWSISKTKVIKPSLLISSFNWSGNTIYVGSGTTSNGTSNFQNYTSSAISISNNESAKDVGNYTITFSLVNTDGYEWEDSTIANIDILWSIVKFKLQKPTLITSTLDWTGEILYIGSGTATNGTDNFQNYDATKITISGTTSAKDVGNYTITFSLKNVDALEWSDGTNNTIQKNWSIFREIKKISIPSVNSGLFYNGLTQTGVESGTGYTIVGNTAINAGNYTATLTLKDYYIWELSNGQTSTQVQTLYWSIDKLTLPKPVVKSSNYSYDGDSHKIIFQNFNEKWINIESNDEKTVSGTYPVQISLVDNNNCEWNDGTNTQYTIYLVINKKIFTKPSLKVKTFNWTNQTIYVGTGTDVDGISNFQNFDANSMTISGRQSASVVGSYTLIFILSDKTNYEWSDHSINDIDIIWSIVLDPTKISIPTAKTGLIYNGSKQTGVESGTGYMVVDGTKTNAGRYTATLVLQTNYIWQLSDGTTTYDDQTIDWNIAKSSVQKPVVKNSVFEFDNKSHKIQWKTFDSSKIEIVGDDNQTEVGTYNVQIKLKDEQNYMWSDEVVNEGSDSYIVLLVINPRVIENQPTILSSDKENIVIIALSVLAVASFTTFIIIKIAVKKHKKKNASKFNIHRRLR